MEDLNLEHFYLSREESRDIIKFLAKKRKIKNYKSKSSNELLQAIKKNKDSEQQSKNKKRINSIQNLFKPSIDKPNNYIQYNIIHKNPLYNTIYTIYFYN